MTDNAQFIAAGSAALAEYKFVLPITPPLTDPRITWQGCYFNVSSAISLKHADSAEKVDETLQNALLVCKLIPFKQNLRSKFHALLKDDKVNPDDKADLQGGGKLQSPLSNQESGYGIVASVDILNFTVQEILDVRIAPVLGLTGEDPNFNALEAAQAELSPEQKASLSRMLQDYLANKLRLALEESFAPIYAEKNLLSSKFWEGRAKQLHSKHLQPYSETFSFAFPTEITTESEVFFLDDLYCVNPNCNCKTVSCVISQINHPSGHPVTKAGFRYNFETKKFTPMHEVPGKFNPAELFKQFSRNFPIALDVLFSKRYFFMRGEARSHLI